MRDKPEPSRGDLPSAAFTPVSAVLGLSGALAPSRSMQGLLFGVAATDPWTLSLVVLMLLGVTAAACFLPASRAARLDPTRALREQ